MRTSRLGKLAALSGALAAVAFPATESEPQRTEPNRLIGEQSPYLQQHAYNPVDWYPWGDEAFEKARREQKLVLLSIGYSTCHWCHVMNRESFSDPDIAEFLNQHFVCIKVDREERPDVDGVYMTFVQQLTGSGGWPLNVWLTPERKPFFGGTYFPPDRSRGNAGAPFPEILVRINDMWTNDRQGILERSEQIVDALNEMSSQATPGSPDDVDHALIAAAIAAFEDAFNRQTGAFGSGPNFPSAANLSFLLRASALRGLDPNHRKASLDMAIASLDAIAKGGINDHIGGGFHRYTVDGEWRLPHFEKMLYDQATLIAAYVDAWKATRNPAYREIVFETCAYLLRDMSHPEGGFYSAEDAESYETSESEEKREGAFYVWSVEEMRSSLGDDSLMELATAYYGLEEAGNAPSGPYSTAELAGYNTLRIAKSVADLAAELEITESAAMERIDRINAVLFDKRKQRPRPHLDDKIITAWNGLAISALSQSAQAFGEKRFVDAARKSAAFIKAKLYDPGTGQLQRLYRNAPSTVGAFSEDYAYLIQGLIDLYEASAEPQWLEWANDLQETQIRLFYDEDQGGFFGFVESDEIVFSRSKNAFDGSIPSANSISAKNLVRLGQFFDNQSYDGKARQTVSNFLPAIKEMPMRMPALLDAAFYIIRKPIQIVIAANERDNAMLKIASESLLPNRLLLHADSSDSQAFLGKRLEFIRGAQAIDGNPTAYVCENFVCQLPARTPEVLREQLKGLVD